MEENTNVEAATDEKKEEKDEQEQNDEKEKNDEYSYLQRNEFTSEIYKVEVRNLGYFGIGEFKKLLKTKLQLDMTKIKSPQRKDFAFVCFRSREDQERAIQTLNGYKWKGKTLQAHEAKASADPLMKRRNEQQRTDDNSTNGAKKMRTSAEATCPLASLPYEEQIKQKTNEMSELLKKYTNELKRTNGKFKQHSDDFVFEGVLESPKINGYRNKNEFTVGKNADGDIVVGFRLGCYADGSVEVADVQGLPHLPAAAKWAASSFQAYMRQSKFIPFAPEANAGHVRQLMVRTSMHSSELMLVPGVFSTNLTSDELAELKQSLKDFYATRTSDDGAYRCTSLYYQDVKHREAGQMVSPVEHLSGTTHITDTILGLQFRISPLAFFQINTRSADVLYQKAIDLAAPQPHSTVLDICCGTGTIALAFARHCKQVLGVEIVPDAIKDAEYNAEANGISNCKFFAGNADDYIQSMVRQVLYDNAPGQPLDLVAVVDPPRAGLHNRSISAIRGATAIKRLVYISCNPMRAQKNFIELGRPESKQYKGDPFFPKVAVAVDMFPHTTHTELVILFERVSKTAQQPKQQSDEEPKPTDDDMAEQPTIDVPENTTITTTTTEPSNEEAPGEASS